jgi:hypothetical protein
MFREAKQIMVLLAMANCTAQNMMIHRLSSPPTQEGVDIIEHEIRKRIWCFLCIQDTYLITFKKSYSIVMAHATTPRPSNCVDQENQSVYHGEAEDLPLSNPTQNTYMLLQLEITSICRTLYDENCQLETAGRPMDELFQKVLEADTKMIKIARSLPLWLRSGPSLEDASRTTPFLQNLSRTFRITFAHMRISMHRSFFCRGVTDRRFFYSHTTCLESARSILKTYRHTAFLFENEIWTIPAHVISACIIVTLNILFFRDGGDDFALEPSQRVTDDQSLMEECLELLQHSRRSNHIVWRGTVMIRRLLSAGPLNAAGYTSLDGEETSRLAKEVEDLIRHESSAPELNVNLQEEDVFGILNF